MELTIDEINNLTKNNDILMARNEELVKALEDIRDRVNRDCKRCTSECDCDETCTRCFIKDKIKEVLQ